MARVILLDADPLGLLSKAPHKSDAAACHAWIRSLESAGDRVMVPEIADYEVRRELLRLALLASLKRHNAVISTLEYDPITTQTMRKAAVFWAFSRRMGIPTAAPKALDADVILAAHASLLATSGQTVIVATTNVGHLSRFVDARRWDSI